MQQHQNASLNVAGLDIKAACHAAGINLRYLGRVRFHSTSNLIRSVLMVEMISRTVKHILRKKMRSLMKRLKAPISSPFRTLVVTILNLVFGSSPEATAFWNERLKPQLVFYFPSCLSREERRETFNFRDVLPGHDLPKLFLAIVKQSTLKFRPRCAQDFTQDPHLFNHPQPFDDTDLEEIGVAVHHMNIMTLAQGYVLKNKGRQCHLHSGASEARLYRLAMEKFEEALLSNASDLKALRELADTAYLLKNNDLASEYYQRLLEANPHDALTLFKYATFLEATGALEDAEECYLQSLEVDPLNDHCLQKYANFLDKSKRFQDGEIFHERAAHCRKMRSEIIRLTELQRTFYPKTPR